MSNQKEWLAIYTMIELLESNTDTNIPFLRKDWKGNGIYRQGVNDGLRLALGKLRKPRVSFIKQAKRRGV